MLYEPLPFGFVPHWIAFHVTQHGVEMVIIFDGKRLVGSLVQMARPDRFVMQVPTPNMRRCQSLHKATQIPVMQRPEHQPRNN